MFLSIKQKNTLLNWAEQNQAIIFLGVFGSYYKGTARDDSDIDIVVDIKPLPSDTNKLTTYIREKNKWAQELTNLLNKEIQIEGVWANCVKNGYNTIYKA